MDIKAKLRPFYVAKMLYEQTDEDHYLTIAQIMEQLDKDYGISTSRGTVGDDIKALQELGVEIAVESSTQKRYYMIGRRFDIPELKTMIDAIESARFIPKEKSAALVKKIGSLTSFHNTEKLVRNVDVENRIKADNEKVYYIMEARMKQSTPERRFPSSISPSTCGKSKNCATMDTPMYSAHIS